MNTNWKNVDPNLWFQLKPTIATSESVIPCWSMGGGGHDTLTLSLSGCQAYWRGSPSNGGPEAPSPKTLQGIEETQDNFSGLA